MSLDLPFGIAYRRDYAAADLLDAALDRQAAELVDRQRDEQLDAVFENNAGIAEGAPLLGFRAAHGGGIGDAPMRGHRIAGPHRAQFARRLVANRDHKIHYRGAGPAEFIPAFTAQPVCWQIELFQRLYCQRM